MCEAIALKYFYYLPKAPKQTHGFWTCDEKAKWKAISVLSGFFKAMLLTLGFLWQGDSGFWKVQRGDINIAEKKIFTWNLNTRVKCSLKLPHFLTFSMWTSGLKKKLSSEPWILDFHPLEAEKTAHFTLVGSPCTSSCLSTIIVTPVCLIVIQTLLSTSSCLKSRFSDLGC